MTKTGEDEDSDEEKDEKVEDEDEEQMKEEDSEEEDEDEEEFEAISVEVEREKKEDKDEDEDEDGLLTPMNVALGLGAVALGVAVFGAETNGDQVKLFYEGIYEDDEDEDDERNGQEIESYSLVNKQDYMGITTMILSMNLVHVMCKAVFLVFLTKPRIHLHLKKAVFQVMECCGLKILNPKMLLMQKILPNLLSMKALRVKTAHQQNQQMRISPPKVSAVCGIDCVCDCGCAESGVCNCGESCPCDCGCGVESFGTDSLVEEPDWIPDGDGRALGQQNLDINLSPLHAEQNEYHTSNVFYAEVKVKKMTSSEFVPFDQITSEIQQEWDETTAPIAADYEPF